MPRLTIKASPPSINTTGVVTLEALIADPGKYDYSWTVTPKVVEAPKPPDPPRPPEPPKAVEAPPAAAPAQAVEAPKETPTFVQRPSVVGTKPVENKEGQVTFDESKPASPAATTTEKPKQAKADKPRRKRVHWDEARIMREVYRYSGYAGMIGGW